MPRRNRFAGFIEGQPLRNPENRRLKTANLFAQFAKIAAPESPVPDLAIETARGATAEAVRKDRFAQLQTGAAPRISTFGLSAEQVGQIDRDATNRFQFLEGQRLAGERAAAQITSQQDIAAGGIAGRRDIAELQIQGRATAAAEKFRLEEPARLAGLNLSQAQLKLAEKNLDVALKRLEKLDPTTADRILSQAEIISKNPNFFGDSRQALFEAVQRLETVGDIEEGVTEEMFPDLVFGVTKKPVKGKETGVDTTKGTEESEGGKPSILSTLPSKQRAPQKRKSFFEERAEFKKQRVSQIERLVTITGGTLKSGTIPGTVVVSGGDFSNSDVRAMLELSPEDMSQLMKEVIQQQKLLNP